MPGTRTASNQFQIDRRHLLKYPCALIRRQSPQRAEQPAEHGAIVIEYREVPILEQRAAIHPLLLASDPAAVDGAPQYPVHRPVPMIGTAIAVFAKGTAEFGNPKDHG